MSSMHSYEVVVQAIDNYHIEYLGFAENTKLVILHVLDDIWCVCQCNGRTGLVLRKDLHDDWTTYPNPSRTSRTRSGSKFELQKGRQYIVDKSETHYENELQSLRGWISVRGAQDSMGEQTQRPHPVPRCCVRERKFELLLPNQLVPLSRAMEPEWPSAAVDFELIERRLTEQAEYYEAQMHAVHAKYQHQLHQMHRDRESFCAWHESEKEELERQHRAELQKLHNVIITTPNSSKCNSELENVESDTCHGLPSQDMNFSEPHQGENTRHGGIAKTSALETSKGTIRVRCEFDHHQGTREIERLKSRESLLTASEATLQAKIRRTEEQVARHLQSYGRLSSKLVELASQNTELSEDKRELEHFRDGLGTLLGSSVAPQLIWMILNLRDDYTNDGHASQAFSVMDGWPRIANSTLMKEFWPKMDPIGFADLPQAIRMLNLAYSEESCAADAPRLIYCYVCKSPKLARRAPSHECYDFRSGRCNGVQRSLKDQDALPDDLDFPCHWNETPCCKHPVCATCLTHSLEVHFKEDFWQHLQGDEWVSCPVPHCDARLDLSSWPASVINQFLVHRHPAKYYDLPRWRSWLLELRVMLQKIAMKQAGAVLDGNMLLREARSLQSTLEYWQVAVDPYFWPKGTEQTEAPSASIMMCEIDRLSFQVPLMLQALRRKTDGIECPICTEVYHEIEVQRGLKWEEICAGFEGPWMWQVFDFPQAKHLGCDHPMDTCRHCYADQITAQLEQNGSKKCHEISCVQCNRFLTPEEIKHFASKESYQLYERYMLLEALSKEPNFRWCLSVSCKSGQVYDVPEHGLARVSCSECGFQMCLEHDIPWHSGMTCVQFSNQISPDEAELKTAEWKRAHTKQCPGPRCGVFIEKDRGCFHMTCSACRYQFCWECLVSWDIVRPPSGPHNRTGHREGCFFRTSRLTPTEVRGTDLVDAGVVAVPPLPIRRIDVAAAQETTVVRPGGARSRVEAFFQRWAERGNT